MGSNTTLLDLLRPLSSYVDDGRCAFQASGAHGNVLHHSWGLLGILSTCCGLERQLSPCLWAGLSTPASTVSTAVRWWHPLDQRALWLIRGEYEDTSLRVTGSGCKTLSAIAADASLRKRSFQARHGFGYEHCVPCLRLGALPACHDMVFAAARKGALYGQHSDLAHRMEIHDAGPVC